MKSKLNACFCMCILAAIIFSNCAKTRHYDFSLKNTVSIFMLNNGKNNFFCIPIQYMGDYKIENFEFNTGEIQIGNYKLLLKRDEINIYAYLNEAINEFETTDGEFNLIFSEENGRIVLSKMAEPLTIKQPSDGKWNYYYFFIEKHLNNDEMKKIINEYEKGNVYSKLSVWYDITIDNEEQNGSGLLDDFELSTETDMDYASFFPNLNFFREKYPQKGL